MTIHFQDPLPTKNISKVVKLTHSWPMQLNINRLIFCNPGNVKGYSINPFMARAPNDHSFNPLPTKNILKFVKLTVRVSTYYFHQKMVY